MNWELLYTVSTLACILFAHDTWLFFQVYAMSHAQKDVVFGGLGRSGLIFQIWCLSFALSSVGICCSFYLHVFFSYGPIVILIFACFNVTLVIYNIALLERNTTVVFLCLSVVLGCYILLFAYTLYLYPVDDTLINNAALLYVTHICNGICVLHAFFLDLIIWQRGWWYYILDTPDTSGEKHNLLDENGYV